MPHIATVIPAQAGIQKCRISPPSFPRKRESRDAVHRYRHSRVSGNPEMPAGNWIVFNRTVLDSRLRGNDGSGGGRNDGSGGYPACNSSLLYALPTPYYALPTIPYVIPSVAEESECPTLTPYKTFRFLGYARNDILQQVQDERKGVDCANPQSGRLIPPPQNPPPFPFPGGRGPGRRGGLGAGCGRRGVPSPPAAGPSRGGRFPGGRSGSSRGGRPR